MKNFKYLPIPKEYADSIRKEKKDNFGYHVEIQICGEQSYGPCRSCLKQTLPGERRLLFSYDPVKSDNPYNEVGPCYIHERECSPYENIYEFPEEVRNGRIHIPLVLRCYNLTKHMIDAILIKNNHDVENQIEKLFENKEVAFIHVRNAEAQCFIIQVERNN
jgi:hypothetical protein